MTNKDKIILQKISNYIDDVAQYVEMTIFTSVIPSETRNLFTFLSTKVGFAHK